MRSDLVVAPIKQKDEIMKLTTLLPFVALTGSFLCGCQLLTGGRAGLEALRSQKLGKAVFRMNPWFTDFDQARALAKAEGKLLFTYFTRSYAR